VNLVMEASSQEITVSEAAAEEIRKQAAKRGFAEPIIRIGVRGGGCSGFAYLFDWEGGEPREKDRVFRQHGVAVYVDAKSFELLKGMELDFTRSVMGHGFKFKNPNVKGTCGCGESIQF
jgi:iron-sulfur cluster assembly protein